MDFDPQFLAALRLVFGYSGRRESRLKKRGFKFAHYTSAEVGAQIILKQNVWMRNASSMNDYSEVAFGSTCLKNALGQHGKRFFDVLNSVHPGLCEQVLDWLGRADFNNHQHTYLTCVSEHRPNDLIGQLSMWRAYGGPTAGVALIFNADFLDLETSSLASWSSPVLYGDSKYVEEFERLVVSFEQNLGVLQAIEPDVLKNMLYNALQFSILSAKHIGFQEEREWRIIHSPRENASAWVQPTFETVRGKPEVVYHLPLQNAEGMNLPELDLDRLLHRVIIGPCQNPYQVASTFQDILESKGIKNADDRITLSLIPLRQLG